MELKKKSWELYFMCHVHHICNITPQHNKSQQGHLHLRPEIPHSTQGTHSSLSEPFSRVVYMHVLSHSNVLNE